jgi:hypothetical protein
VIITYTPAEGEKREWQFTPRKLMSPEAEAIEKVTKWTFQEFGAKFLAGSMLAYRAVVWIMLKRENPPLRFDDVSICMDDISVGFDDQESAQIREVLLADPDLDPEQRANLTEILGEDEAELPKDPTTSSTTTTETPE